ncbi:J domain-containing protein [Aquimarina litoralis]|uniref:J domain-containing protein n=1 Tax=Aquimarina litoralis TaxID=584605 RepID=UPI001C57F877|nr:J domain-containing protein [Aquimarina litoralis]MBW1298249.1 hypothetical protein [Aquimarina litoralis]
MKNLSILLTCLLAFVLLSCENEIENIHENATTEPQEKHTRVIVTPKQVGGSNYTMYDTQGYRNTGIWSSPDNLKLVIGHYHLNPTKVHTQLQQMYQNGQRKIGLVIWYTHFPPYWPNSNTHLHTIRSNNSSLPYQQEQNFKNVLQKIKSIGYNEVTIRFAAQGLAHPEGWQSWNETQFQENWNFIYNAINTAENTLGNSSLKRMYDLDVEMGGRFDGQTVPYMDKLWRNFSYVYPNLKSYGFSIAYAPGRLDRLIKNLKQTGRNADEYAIDIYENASQALITIKNELNKNREYGKSIVIQETYYNDKQQYRDFISGIKSNNLNVRFIMQWPWRRGFQHPHFSENYPKYYDNYLPLDVEIPGDECNPICP